MEAGERVGGRRGGVVVRGAALKREAGLWRYADIITLKPLDDLWPGGDP